MSKLITMLACVSPNGDPNQNPPIRVCHMPHKLTDEQAQLDLSDCKLELSGLDTEDFKVCPFCINALYKNPPPATVPTEPKVYQTRTGNGELVPVTYLSSKIGSKTVWFVGEVMSTVDLATRSHDMISPQTILIQRQTVIEALKTAKAYDESTFGLYTVSVD